MINSMTTISKQKGVAARTANKIKRRENLLSTARSMIAEQGLDAFTLSELASKTDVTLPTIHNLLGKKADIFATLVGEMVVRVEQVLSESESSDPISSAELFIDNLIALFAADEAFYKAAFVAGERTQFFEHHSQSGIFAKSMRLARQICVNALRNGYLEGEINSDLLANQLFGCQRLARQDWVNGYINLKEYRSQVLTGMFITYSSDATPEFKAKLINEIAKQ